jgi:N-acetyl-anhydromuramyl-L-alanine amidase AmpD
VIFTTPPLTIIDRPADGKHQSGPRSEPIRLIVIHSTAGSRDSSLGWLTVDPDSRGVSAHRLIDYNGDIYKLVDDSMIAHHAGYSTFGERTNVNPFSLGIELVNRNDGVDAYPESQLVACAKQVVEWWGRYGFIPVVGHSDIDTGEDGTRDKTDPRNFPWSHFWLLCDDYRLSLARNATGEVARRVIALKNDIADLARIVGA